MSTVQNQGIELISMPISSAEKPQKSRLRNFSSLATQQANNLSIDNPVELEEEQPQFYKSKKRPRALESSGGGYPEATIREYLNQKRTTQNKVCHVGFCICMIVVIMLLGIGFFFGSFSQIGLPVNANANTDPLNPSEPGQCPAYISEDLVSCIGSCAAPGVLYLQRVCAGSGAYNPVMQEALSIQVNILTMKASYGPLVYGSLSALALSGACVLLLMCWARLAYAYVAVSLIALLGFAFFLLKNVRAKLDGFETGSVFYSDAEGLMAVAYALMAGYLVAFPVVLFSPHKLQLGVRILARMQSYLRRMQGVNAFTCLLVLLTWGLCMAEIFLLMNMFAAGDPQTQNDAFVYMFPDSKLSHPAVLTLHALGIYWFFATLLSWHRYFVGSAMCLWYFEQGKLYPVTRGLKRSWHSLGTASLDALLLPFEWLALALYALCKFSPQEQQKDQEQQQVKGWACLRRLREILQALYWRVNPLAAAAAPLTNLPFKESCQIAATTFTMQGHRLFGLGTTLHCLLVLTCCLLWLVLCYLVLNVTVYSTTSPPPIRSLVLPLVAVLLSALVTSSLLVNLYTAALDSLIFCFLLEKKDNVHNRKNELKELLETILQNEDEETNLQLVEMYEYQED